MKTLFYSLIIVLGLGMPVLTLADDINVVQNGALETPSSNTSIPQSWQKGGTGNNTRIHTYGNFGVGGTKAVKVEMTAYTDGDAKWYFQNVPVVGGESYKYEQDYLANTTSFVTLRYQLQDGTFKYPDLERYLPETAGAFVHFSKTLTVPTNYSSPVQYITVFPLIKSVGSIIIDNVSLIKTDSSAPQVSVDAPASPASGTITLSATASDDVGVTNATFFIDNISVGSTAISPYTLSFDTTTVTNGTHALTAKSTDAAGNTTTSAPQSFSVNNTIVVPEGTITVQVSVINDNGGTKTTSDFPIFIDFTNVAPNTPTAVEPGPHHIGAIADENYTRMFGGDCNNDGDITVADGESATCSVAFNDIEATPPVPNQNPIPNPSVETAQVGNSSIPANWQKGGTGANTRILTYPVAGYDGARAVKTDITTYTDGDAKWYFAPISTESGSKYIFTDYYKATTTSYLTMQFKLQDGTFKYVDILKNIPAQANWTKAQASFQVPTYSQPVVAMTVFHLIKSVGSITVDNYSFTAVSSTTQELGNLIGNGNLELVSLTNANVPQGWNHAASAGISNPSFMYPIPGRLAGSKAAQVSASAYTSGAGAKWYFAEVPVTAGNEYHFRDYYSGSAPSFVTAQFRLQNGTYKYMDLERLVASPSWKKFESNFIAPENAVGLVIQHGIQSAGTLTIDDYFLEQIPLGVFTTGFVSLNFDDGLKSVYQTAIPKLNAANLKSSQYIISETLDYTEDDIFVSKQQMLNMGAAGHELGTHTKSHPYLTQLSAADAIDEIAGAKTALDADGAEPNTTFAYPFGDFNDVIRQNVIDAGFIGARSIYTGYNTKNTDKFALRDQHVENNTTAAEIIGYIDHAMATKTWLILEIHDVDHSGSKYSTTPQILQTVINYIVANNIPVKTTAEGIALM